MSRFSPALNNGWFVVDKLGKLPPIHCQVKSVALVIARTMNKEEKSFCKTA